MSAGAYSREALAARIGEKAAAIAEAAAAAAPAPSAATVEKLRRRFAPTVNRLMEQRLAAQPEMADAA